MKVGVFGSTGFIGRHLLRRLQAEGIEYSAFSHRSHSLCPDAIPIEFENPTSYRDHLAGISTVILLVSQSTPGSLANRAESEVLHNVLPYSRFLEVVGPSSIDHVIFVSSGGTVYGRQEHDLVSEDHPTRPLNAYGAGKLMIETMIQTILAERQVDWTVLRPSNPVGVDQAIGRVGFVTSAVHAAMTGHTLSIWGDGSVVRDYFHVNDLANAIVPSIGAFAARNAIFNVGSGIGTSVNGVVDIVEQMSSYVVKRTYAPARQVDVPRNVLSIDRIVKTLGWKPSRDLSSIIRDMVDDLRADLV